MHRTRATVVAALLTTLVSAGALIAPPTGAAGPPRPGPAPAGLGASALVVPGASPAAWAPLTPDKWAFDRRRGEVVLTEAGEAPEGPRRPFEYAVVRRGPELGSLTYRAQVRIDESVDVDNRDVILVWNHRSPTRFYYAHLSQDNTIYPHNGIFVVDDADRVRIDDQWDGALGAPPAIDDADWHDVRLDYDAATGEIAVYVDDVGRGAEPLMTATDTTFAGGRIGFGSFDNYGRVRHVVALGTPVRRS